MSKIIELKVSDDPLIDASATTETDVLTIEGLNNYSITFVKSGTDGNPIVEVLGSNDGVNFVNPYFEDNGSTAWTFELTDTINGTEDAFDFLFKFFRIKTIPNGTTTGTLNYFLNYENGI